MKKILQRGYRVVKALLGGHGIGKLYLIKLANNYLTESLKTTVAIVQGNKMFLDAKDSLNLSVNGIYEEYETDLIKKEVHQGDVVIDIGANIGYYTLIFAKLVGENGKVFAFEPDPTNFALLKKNVKINGYKNVTLVQQAAADKAERIKLYLSEDNLGDHRIYDSHDNREFIESTSITLDEYFNNYTGPINFIKIDTQGAEWAAAKGMYELLKKNKSVKIVSEFWPIGLKRFGVEPAAYLKLLLELDFELYQLVEKHKRLEPINVEEVLATYTPEKENFTNLYCARK